MSKPYSKQFTARQNPRRYLLSGIPPTLWETVQRKARAEHIAVRQVILRLLEDWTDEKIDITVPADEQSA